MLSYHLNANGLPPHPVRKVIDDRLRPRGEYKRENKGGGNGASAGGSAGGYSIPGFSYTDVKEVAREVKGGTYFDKVGTGEPKKGGGDKGRTKFTHASVTLWQRP